MAERLAAHCSDPAKHVGHMWRPTKEPEDAELWCPGRTQHLGGNGGPASYSAGGGSTVVHGSSGHAGYGIGGGIGSYRDATSCEVESTVRYHHEVSLHVVARALNIHVPDGAALSLRLTKQDAAVDLIVTTVKKVEKK